MFTTIFRLNAIKKLLFLLIACVILISCESDNDSNVDPIIGTWKIESILQNNKEMYNSDDCNSKSSIVYFSDGTYLNNLFYKDIIGACIHSEANFSWVNLGNYQYFLAGEKIELEFYENYKSYKITTDIVDIIDNSPVKLVMIYRKI